MAAPASAAEHQASQALLVLGMAGSLSRGSQDTCAAKALHLGPAGHEVPFPANIDSGGTVNSIEVMQQHGLGPSSGTVSSPNLSAPRFDQVMKSEKAQTMSKYVLIDTHGQIEAITWPASGRVITEALTSSFPTSVIYVMDTSRSSNPISFMSNRLCACSILYKTRFLPW